MNLLTVACLVTLQSLLIADVNGEKFNVRLSTLEQGTDGVLRIKLFGTLGDSAYIDLGTKGFFSDPQSSKNVDITTAETVGYVLKISLALFQSTRSIEVDKVTVTEQVLKRSVIFIFKQYIVLGGGEKTVDAPSPDLSTPTISIKNASASTDKLTLKEGSDFSLTASVTKSSSQAEVKYQWYQKSFFSTVPKLVGSGKNLHIKSVQNENRGDYFCVMSLLESVQKTKTVSLVVNHLTLSPVEVKITGSSFIREGSKISLICTSSSNLEENVVTWYNDSTPLISNNIRTEYTIDSIHRNQSGTYTCQATAKGFGEVKRQNTEVIVIYLDDPKIRGHTIINNTLRLLSNESSELYCDTESNLPNIQYTFTENGNVLKTTGNKFIVKTGGGNYSCTVKNSFITKTLAFKIIAGNLKGPNGGNGGTTSATTKDDDDFWTTEMIVIIVMAITFFIILVVLLCLICVLIKRQKEKGYEKKPSKEAEINLTPQKVYNGSTNTDSQNNFINDNLTNQRGPTLGDIQKFPAKDQLSISSEEYRSSTNDIRPPVTARVNGGQPTETIPETNSEYAHVEKPKKNHRSHHNDDKSHRSKHRDRSRNRKNMEKTEKPADEVDSNWSYANNSTVNISYDDVEYC